MKPLVQKLPPDEDSSFVARTYRTPHFEVGWHRHPEIELILFTEGNGQSFVGNHAGTFENGDIYLLGSNLPHSFQKADPGQITSAVVVQFMDDFWGPEFLDLPESRPVRELLEAAGLGLKASPELASQLAPLIKALETASGFRRVLLLGECLERFNDYQPVATGGLRPTRGKEQELIDRIFSFTTTYFREQISISRVAELACLSVPAFCSYFKRSTQKTYLDFLHEVRISHASTLLLETNRTILDIGDECGYATQANFHKQFQRIKKLSPLQFRKQFAGKLSQPQNNIGII